MTLARCRRDGDTDRSCAAAREGRVNRPGASAGRGYERHMRGSIVVALLCISSPAAFADGRDANMENVMAGPVFGFRLGGPPGGTRGVIGFEAGYGIGPERINLGFEYRGDTSFGYVELDPWAFVGASLGLGIDTNGDSHPVLGVWEGVPLHFHSYGCDPRDYRAIVTLAAGYRYTGIHELYFTVKAGASEPLCF